MSNWRGKLQTRPLRNGVAALYSSAFNLQLILDNDSAFKGRFRHNQFSNVYEVNAPAVWHPAAAVSAPGFRPFQDVDLAAAKAYICEQYDFDPHDTDMREQMRLVAFRNGYNPLVDRLRATKWDGVDRLDTWLTKYFGVQDNVYTRRVSRMWPISAIARAISPGCKVDTMLIMEGAQGLLKSSAFRVLAGDEFFSDTEIDIGTKDSRIALQGVWIKELSELQSMRKAEVERVKAFISATDDKFRLPFDRADSRIPRRVVFVGTTNADAYLQDETGARRFWPVRCVQIDLDGLRAVRDQLWAEALVRYEAGEKWWIATSDPDFVHFENATAIRTETDTWESLVEQWLARTGVSVTTREELFLNVLDLPWKQWDMRAGQRLGRIMKSLKWQRRQSAQPSGTKWFYAAPGLEPDRAHFVAAEQRREKACDTVKLDEFERGAARAAQSKTVTVAKA